MGRASRPWLFFVAALAAAPAVAQSQGRVVRDGTLGEGPLEVGPGTDPLGQPATYLITPELGEQQGSNLFHSFARFDVGTGETATFTGPDPVDGPQSVSNVISRVTGGDPSEIDGTVRSTIPGADLWLLNPSGVMFGEGATLDVPGSFHAGTGDYLGFDDAGLERFYGDPSRPSVLATARPEAFGFLGESEAAPIAVTGATLDVRPGETIELAGGDVTLTAATLDAPRGSISIRGGRIVVAEGSQVLAENAGEGAAGAITVAASESLLVDASLLSTSTSGEGAAGTIHLERGAITLRNGPGLANAYVQDDPLNLPHRVTVGARAETTGSGAAGRLEIDADALTVTAGAGLSAQTVGPDGTFASGDGGVIRIDANSVLVSDLGFATVESWRSTGDAGSIAVDADTLTIDATTRDGLGSDPTTLTASTRTRRFFLTDGTAELGPAYDPADRALGEAGTIEIEARSIHVRNGANVESSCVDCVTRAGVVRLGVAELLVVEGRERTVFPSLVGTVTIGPAARGNGGLIEVTAVSLLVREGGVLDAGTGRGGAGDAGSIVIKLNDRMTLLDGGELVVSAFEGSGNAGSLEVHADSVRIGSSDPGNISAISAGTFDGGTGDGGTIDLRARTLALERGGIINANAEGGLGDAGTITVRTDSVRIGPDPEAPRPGRETREQPAFITASAITPLGSGLVAGHAGVIDIQATTSILVTDAGDRSFPLLGTLVFMASGRAAPLSGIFSVTVEGGDGGSVRLDAPEITVTQGATVATSTIGGGEGGSIELHGERLHVADGGLVDTSSLPHLVTFRESGDAGDVTLDAAESIEIIGAHPHPLSGHDPSRVSSVSAGSGAAGKLTLHAPRIFLDGGAVATTALASANELEGIAGGDIVLDTEELIVRGGGRIDASTFIPGPGGRIEVTASESIRVEGDGSGIASRTGGSGTGGSLTLRAPRIEVSEGGEVSANSELGLGEVERIFVDRGLFGAPAVADGNAGSVTLVADHMLLDDAIVATNSESADGGDVTIQAKKLVHLDGGVITATVTGGTGGKIDIDPEVVLLQNESRIEARAGEGSGGSIDITANNYFAFPGSVVSATAGNPELSGTVEVNTPDVNLAGSLAALPTSYLDAASLMRERCAARRSGERAGSFAVRGSDGIPAEPDGWLPATIAYETSRGAVARASHLPRPGSFPLLSFPGTCR